LNLNLKCTHLSQDTNVAPALQAAQEALEKERLADALGKKLEHRPAVGELVDHNILKGKSISNGSTHLPSAIST
jgi:hypothetical protein